MSTEGPPPPPAPSATLPVPSAPPAGYLSEESKRRFTVVAGVVGTAIFLAQMVLPVAVMFAVMGPWMFMREFKQVRVDQSAVWRGDIWVIEEASRLKEKDPSERTSLFRLRTEDVEPAGPPVPIGDADMFARHALLPIGDTLWILGTDAVRSYDGTSVTRLAGSASPDGISKPFAHGGRPAVLTHWPTMLSTLAVSGTDAQWKSQELDLALPPEAGALRALEALEVDGRLVLFAQVCVASPEHCSIHYRALDAAEWTLATAERCSGEWSVVLRGAHPVVVAVEQEKGRQKRLSVVTLGPGAPRRETVEVDGSELGWRDWRALSVGERLFVLAGGFSESVHLKELADGRVVRTVSSDRDAFPFGRWMFGFMLIPQLLPIVLSLVLAFVLTSQMRLHRVSGYTYEGQGRTFASLWQRALAQAVDAVPIAVAFLVPVVVMVRIFSDPERMLAAGARIMFWFFGGIAVAFVLSGLLLAAYSYGEGRWGKTPGKWLLGIRVVGTDLRPCGFGRAFLRNLLTFVDGFFNFLVGALMVAFTENWQRLGDFAARTIVVTDEKG